MLAVWSGFGTEMPTCESAPDTDACTELGSAPVAAAATPALSASAGIAIPAAFRVSSFPNIGFLLGRALSGIPMPPPPLIAAPIAAIVLS